MRLFLYELITGGGWLHQPDLLAPESLLREGAAMISAVAADFADMPGIEVQVMRDEQCRLSLRERTPFRGAKGDNLFEVRNAAEEARTFRQLAERADWTVLIAPEIDGALEQRCRLVLESGGRLLGPGLPLIALASDKHTTAEHLHSRGIPVPRGMLLEAGEPLPANFAYPAVIKPKLGAGSLGVELVQTAEQHGVRRCAAVASRLESYCPGLAASVAVLCGKHVRHPLLPCRQLVSDDGHFSYLGGSLPLAPALAARAGALALRTIDTLPEPLGYLGVDLVLGNAPDGSQDYVIEINPRLTTSYVGLRAAARTNLAAAWLAIVERRRPEVAWRDVRVQFNSAGDLTTD